MFKERIRQLIKPAVLETKAYHVAESQNLIKLDAMENPYIWPNEVKARWTGYMFDAELNRYPDAGSHQLRDKLASLMNMPEGMEMLLGNGSDELIQIIMIALNKQSNVIMAPEPGFVMYRLLSSFLELDYIGVPLKNDWSLDLHSMLKAITERQPAVIFIAWPNNPSGNLFDRESIEAIIKASSGLVVIDEAYHVFAEQTLIDCVIKYPNVLLMRTLSKLGLAGLRIGMLFGAPEWIVELNKLRLPYNVGTLNQLSAKFMLENINLLEQQAAVIRHDRETVFTSLSAINGIHAWPSEANFILFKVTDRTANKVHAELLKQKILIKNLHGTHTLLDNCLRVTIGTSTENQHFLSALQEIMQ